MGKEPSNLIIGVYVTQQLRISKTQTTVTSV